MSYYDYYDEKYYSEEALMQGLELAADGRSWRMGGRFVMMTWFDEVKTCVGCNGAEVSEPRRQGDVK